MILIHIIAPNDCYWDRYVPALPRAGDTMSLFKKDFIVERVHFGSVSDFDSSPDMRVFVHIKRIP